MNYIKLTIIFIILGILSLNNAFATVKIKAIYENTEIYPYQIGNNYEINDPPGIFIDIVKQIENYLDVKITFTRAPWKRCLKNLEDGSADMLIYSSYKIDREKYGVFPKKNNVIDPTRRIGVQSYSLYRLKGSKVDFINGRIVNTTIVGAPLGYSIVDDLKSQGIKVQESTSTSNNFKKLIAKRVNAVAAITEAGDSLLKEKIFMDKIEKVSPPLKEKNYYIIISHKFYNKHPKLTENIWNNIAYIRDKFSDKFQEKYKK